jgi:hypothetical protein
LALVLRIKPLLLKCLGEPVQGPLQSLEGLQRNKNSGS